MKTKTKTKKTSRAAAGAKVVATDKQARAGTFFATATKLAAKPIALDDLISQVTHEVGKTLKSAKDPAVVVRTRIRSGLKLGWLKTAK